MKKMTIYQLTVTALLAAVLCVVGPLSVPIGEVPFSFSNLVIMLAAYLLGAKLGTVSVLIYLLLGAFGLPVFSGYGAGLAKLVGPTGGYLFGFLFLAAIAGIFVDRSGGSIRWGIVGMLLGEVVLYLFGTMWYMIESGNPFGASMAMCVIPFLPFDALKLIAVGLIGPVLRRRISAAGLLPAAKQAA